MRSFNFVFFALLLAVVTVFGGGIHLLHEFQIRKNAKVLLERARLAETGCDVRLVSPVQDVSDIPRAGKDLIVVAAVGDVLHFRMFGSNGNVLVDSDEKRLTGQARQIEELRTRLVDLWPPHELTESEKVPIITAITSIVDHPPQAKIDEGKALQSLGEYLNILRQDGNVWVWYARDLDRIQLHSNRQRRAGVFLTYEEALRHNPGDSKIERRCAEIALELKRYSDAERHLMNLIMAVRTDSTGQPAAAKLAELEDLLGQSQRGMMLGQSAAGLSRFEEAEKWFVQAIEHDPKRVACYARLAHLRRTDLRRLDEADSTIMEMVARNPGSAMAHIYRWQYADEFLKNGAENEIQRSLRAAANGCDLRLISSLKDKSEIPAGGKDVVIVAAVGKVLHFRIFNGAGKVVVDTAEKRLTQHARQIEDLRKQLVGLWPPHELTRVEQDRLISAVASIVGYTPPSDIQEALKLAPDDPSVLLAAAVASERKPDPAAARAYFEKGVKNDPKNTGLALGLARVESREKHLDKAEAVLRRALQANPVTVLAFALAENLIKQGKIEGKDGAAFYVSLLRTTLRTADLTDVKAVNYLESSVRYLESEMLYGDAERSVRQDTKSDLQRRKWADAINKIEMARGLSDPDASPQLLVQLNLMLAECHRRMGDEEQRLDALRRAAEIDQGPDAARKDLAEALASSGKLEQAVAILLPLAVRKPEWRLDLVRLLLQQAVRAPRDRRNWADVERHLGEAEKALPQEVESLALLRLDVLAAQGRLGDARSLLSSVQAKDPRNLRYRLSLARLTQQQGKSAAALQILDQAEKELGASQELQLARLDYWGMEGGAAAKAAVAKLAAAREQVPAGDRPAFLDRLGSAEIRLGEPTLGRQHWHELAVLQPDNLSIRLKLLDLALAAGDQDAAAGLVEEIKKAEGDEGTTWQLAQAALLIDKVRRGFPENLDQARRLAEKIGEQRPQWAMGVALRGEIEELAGSTDEAIGYYLRAVELGNVPPSLVRRLVGLLNERNRFDEIDRLAKALRDQGASPDIITFERALAAMRKQDFVGGIALARQVFPEASTTSSDHLTLGQFYMVAGRIEEAGKEFRRAVELGRGVPESWLIYVQYLVQTKQIDQARAAILAARQALPADRSTLTLAQCALFLGDSKQAEELVEKAFRDEGKSADPVALRLASTLALRQNRLDQVKEYLGKLGQLTDLSPGDKAWVNRTRVAMLLSKGRPADCDQALALVNQNLRNDSGRIEDQMLKAKVLSFRPAGRGEAVTILERLAGINLLGENERFLLAQLYLDQKNEQKYLAEMLKLVNQKLRNPQHLAHLVNYWIGRNQVEQAERWLAELKKAEPEGVLALELEARLLNLRKHKPELLALLEARGRAIPDQIGTVAELLNRYGFTTEAEAAYKAYVARDARQPERALVLAAFLAGKGRHPEAVEILRDAWKRCRHDAVALAGLEIYGSRSAAPPEKKEVARWLIQAAGERPDDAVLATKLAFIYCQDGRFDEAELLNRRVLARDPDNAQALNNLANLLALHHNDKTTEALQLINRAIALNGPHPTLLDTRAVAMIRAGRSEQAINDLREARDQNPRNVNYNLHLAWAYQAVGRLDEARGLFRRAVELGFKAEQTDALERPFVTKLRRDLSATEATTPVDRKS